MAAGLEQEFTTSTDRLRELVAINRALVETLDYDEVLRLVVEKTAAFTRADGCALLLVEPEDRVRIAASVGIDDAKIEGFEARFDERINGALQELLGFSDDDTFLGVPVIHRSVIEGLLVVYRRGPAMPDTEERFFVTALADQAAIALEHARRYEEVSRISEHKSRLLEAIQSNTATALAYLDPELRFVEANAAFCTATGYTQTELTGKRHAELFPESEVVAQLEQVRTTGTPVEEREFPYTRDERAPYEWNGILVETTYWDWSARPVLSSTGVVEGIVISAIDVTEKVLARGELEAAHQRKDEFLAMLAHELRNPLAAISSAVDVLQARIPADERTARIHEAARRQVRHMTRLLDDLLDVSRITRGKIELKREPVGVDAIVHQAIQTTTPLMRSMGHDLSVTLPPEPLTVRGDADRLVQVVSNLLTNAAKFTPAGGHIWVEVHPGDEEVRIQVRDDGAGIPPDRLPHVFELFAQSDRTLDRTQGGLGIGLTLVKRLVEMHGGRVEARSEGPNRGSEFTIVLPTQPARATERSGHGVAAPPSVTGRRILLVEDNRDTAETLAAFLDLEGHEVHVAPDGPTALDLARQADPEVVLLDIGLPGMDGHEMARRLQRRGRAGKAPIIIALTGYGGQDHRSRADECGIDQFLVKPVAPEALRRALSTRRG